MSLEMKYFVLKPSAKGETGIASRRAMTAYAEWLFENGNEEEKRLAADVQDWAAREHKNAIERGEYRDRSKSTS